MKRVVGQYSPGRGGVGEVSLDVGRGVCRLFVKFSRGFLLSLRDWPGGGRGAAGFTVGGRLVVGPGRLITFLRGPYTRFAGRSVGQYVRRGNVHVIGFVCPTKSKQLGALGFIVGGRTCLSTVLAYKRHISNSDLFPFVRTNDDSLCMVPQFQATFLSPFTRVPALSVLYSFFGGSKRPLRDSPRRALRGTYGTFGRMANVRFRTVKRLRCCMVTPSAGVFRTASRGNCRRSTPCTGFGSFHARYVTCVTRTNKRVGCKRSRMNGFALGNVVCRRGRVRFLPIGTRSTTSRLVVTG